MSTETESLRELYVEVTDRQTLTDAQEKEHPREPAGEREADIERTVSDVVRNDGLGDAVADAETGAAEPSV